MNAESTRPGYGKSGKKQSLISHSAFRFEDIPALAQASLCVHILVFIMLFILVWPVVLWSQDNNTTSDIGLSASLGQESARLGSMVELTLGYRLPEGGRLPEQLEIRGLEDLTIVKHEIESDQIRVKLLVDKLGLSESGPISLAYVDKQGQRQYLKTDPVSIEVSSNLGEKPAEAQLRPIQGIIPTKALWLKYLPWGVGLLGALLTVAGLLWWRKRRQIQDLSAEIYDPPHIRAGKEIEQLETQGLFEKGHIKGFYFRFSEILRRYLGALRGFPGSEFTTEEIALCINNEPDRKLLSLLKQADLVKFADTIPTPARKEEEVKTALSHIQETTVEFRISETGRSADGPQGATQ